MNYFRSYAQTEYTKPKDDSRVTFYFEIRIMMQSHINHIISSYHPDIMVHFNRHTNNEGSNKIFFLESFCLVLLPGRSQFLCQADPCGVGRLHRSPSAEGKACTAQGAEGMGRWCD